MSEIIQSTITLLGGPGRVATRLGVSEQTVRGWAIGSKPVPREAAETMEDMSGGDISAQLLAPDAGWGIGPCNRLPLEISRCEGEHPALGTCADRGKCWRHTALSDRGHRTPVMAHLCADGESRFVQDYAQTGGKS